MSDKPNNIINFEDAKKKRDDKERQEVIDKICEKAKDIHWEESDD